MTKSSIILAVLLSATSASITQADWPGWLGPLHSGASPAGSPPVHWSRTEGVAWTAELGSPTASSPIVWQYHVFIASRSENDGKVSLHAFDRRNGKIRWTRDLGLSREAPHGISLLTDGSHVVAFQSNGDLRSFNFDGLELWRKNVPAGRGWTPSQGAVQAGKLFIQLPVSQRNQPDRVATCRVLAIDLRDGKQVWEQNVSQEAQSSEATNFSLVPTAYEGKHLLLMTAFGRVHCLKQADGRPVWESKRGELTAGQPVKEMCLLGDSLLLVTPQDGSSMSAASISLQKGLSKLWDSPVSGHLLRPHALLNGTGVFVHHQGNDTLDRIDSQTGHKKWSAKLPAGNWTQAPRLGAEGKIYCLGTTGDVAVLNSETGRVLTWTPMKTTDRVAGVPGMALSANQLFVSVGTRLHCIEGATVGTREVKPVEGERIGEPPGLNRRRLPL